MPIAVPSPDDLKAFRQQRGWSRVAFAEQLGSTVRTIEDWEAGRRKPQPILGLALHYIVLREANDRQLELLRTGQLKVRQGSTDITAEAVTQLEDQNRQLATILQHGGWGSEVVAGMGDPPA